MRTEGRENQPGCTQCRPLNTDDPTVCPCDLAGYMVLVTAVPEPSYALLGGLGLITCQRSRR